MRTKTVILVCLAMISAAAYLGAGWPESIGSQKSGSNELPGGGVSRPQAVSPPPRPVVKREDQRSVLVDDSGQEGTVVAPALPQLEPIETWLLHVLGDVGNGEPDADGEAWLRRLVREGMVDPWQLVDLLHETLWIRDSVAGQIFRVMADVARNDETLRRALIEAMAVRDRAAKEELAGYRRFAAIAADLRYPETSRQAVHALPPNWGNDSGLVSAVVDLATNEEHDVATRMAAIGRIGELARDDMFGVLESIAIEHHARELEIAAVRAIAKLSSAEAGEFLLEISRQPAGVGPVLRFAVRGLERFPDSAEATAILLRTYDRHADPAVRLQAVHALAAHGTGNRDAQRALADVLQSDEGGAMKRAAAFGLLRCGDVAEAIDAVGSALSREGETDTAKMLRAILTALEER